MRHSHLQSLCILLCLLCTGYSPQAQVRSIEEVVTSRYIHGLPYEEIRSYGDAAVPQLVSMLQNPDYEEYHSNIVAALGFIGSADAIDPLLEYVYARSGEISVHEFRAVLGVFRALGHIAQNGDERSMNTLIEYNSLETWKTKGLDFSYARYRGEALSEVICRQVIHGMGISGRAEAYEALSRIQNSRAMRPDWQDNVDEAMELNRKVKNQGAANVFGKGGRR